MGSDSYFFLGFGGSDGHRYADISVLAGRRGRRGERVLLLFLSVGRGGTTSPTSALDSLPERAKAAKDPPLTVRSQL